MTKTFRNPVFSYMTMLVLVAAYSTTFAADQIEEVVVTGIPLIVKTSISNKKNAQSITESLILDGTESLQGTTVSDSLQRVSGVQIQRSAGEGGTINLRGLPQVGNLLNGEQYLSTHSIVHFQPNFVDIPSLLLKELNITKSPTAKMLNSGLSGTIDLKTHRPFDYADGLHGSTSLSAGYGFDTQEANPSISVLMNWKTDKVGLLVSASSGKFELANHYEGKRYGPGLGADGIYQEGGTQGWEYGNSTFLGDHDATANEWFYGPEGWEVYANTTERNRNGANVSLQVNITPALELTSDYFYTQQDEWSYGSGLAIETVWANWPTFNNFSVSESKETHTNGINTFQSFDFMGRSLQSYSQASGLNSKAENVNIELHYRPLNRFSADLRIIQSKASQDHINNSYRGNITDGGPTNTYAWQDATRGVRIPGQWVLPNPNGIQGMPQIHIDHSSQPSWSGFENLPVIAGLQNEQGNHIQTVGTRTVADFLLDPDSYAVGSAESNWNYNQQGSLDIVRGDMSYTFDKHFISSIDFGVRASKRLTVSDYWHGVSKFYENMGGVTSEGTPNPEGCLARWAGALVAFDQDCQVGEFGDFDNDESTDDTWIPWSSIGHIPQNHLTTLQMSNFGDIEGLPPVWVVDPRSIKNVAAFQADLYGNFIKRIDENASYRVRFNQYSFYMQANFEHEHLSGNAGIRFIDSQLTVNQKYPGASGSYGITPEPTEFHTERQRFSDFLPALNLAYSINNQFLLRGAYSVNMMPLNMNEWGDSVESQFAPNSQGSQSVVGVYFGGDAQLEPWRSDIAEVSAEWYLSESGLLSAGYFNMNISGFPIHQTSREPWIDLDGTIKNDVEVTRKLNGDEGKIDGLELSVKYSFTELPIGIDSNITILRSSDKNLVDIYAHHPDFYDLSKVQSNLAIWFEGEQGLQVRMAYNYRGKRRTGNTLNHNGINLMQYVDAVGYLDLGVSQSFANGYSIQFTATNITNEHERYFLQWKDQYTGLFSYEPRYTIGVRALF